MVSIAGAWEGQDTGPGVSVGGAYAVIKNRMVYLTPKKSQQKIPVKKLYSKKIPMHF